MAAKTVLTLGFVLQVATASAQLSPSTFGGIPLWADSALRTAGLDQRFMLTSKLNPVFALGDFDRDVARDRGGARVSRSAKDFADARRLFQFPGKRVFASASADDEDFHSRAGKRRKPADRTQRFF